MKRIFLLFILIFNFLNAQTPRAGGINNIQATVLNTVHDNFVGVQTTNLNAFAVYNFSTNFDHYLGLKSTDNIAEGTLNKYFSNTLARNAFSAGTGLIYSAGVYGLDSVTQGILASVSGKYPIPTGLITEYIRGDGTRQTLNTTVVPEGTNLYYTDNRARASISLTTTGTGAATYTGGVLNIPTPVINTYTSGAGINIASNVITNTAPDQTVNITSGNRISATGTYPNFTVAYIEPTINTAVARTLNSNFTVSATKQASVIYSVTCQVTNPLLAGNSTATAFLEYSTNGGSTWNLLSQNGNQSAVGVAVAIAITNTQTVVLAGTIPANALVRIRTTTSGTASVTYVTGTEIY